MPSRFQVSILRAFSLALCLTGIVLLAGGLKLLMLGGSWWYALAGTALLASSVLLWCRSRWGTWLYGLLLLGTVAWSLWEVGLDGWALLPRLGLLIAGGLWLLTPLGHAALRPAPAPLLGARSRTATWIAIVVATCALAVKVLMPWQAPAIAETQATIAAPAATDWRHYGNDSHGTRYSPLSQITPANVGQLQVAWQARTGDLPAEGVSYSVEATPLQVGQLIYVCTPGGQVLAMDAVNGQRAWHFDPHAKLAGADSACRGLAYSETEGTGPCAKRIYTATPDSRLWALDALSGNRCADFGDQGAVDLKQGLGEVPQDGYTTTSPPLVTGNRVVIGSAVAGKSDDIPSGVVRAYDARSGALVWAWDVGRPDRTGAPAPGETYTRGTPNVWAPLIADDAAGLIYLPTGSPGADFYGKARREYSEAFDTSIVAVSAETGATRWKFQITRHDVWDLDLSAHPTLLDMPGPQGMQPAIAVGTKSGDIFVLNRLTGEPIVGVADKPVAHSTSVEPGLSATQPQSALVVNPGPEELREASMWGVTFLDQMWCRISYREARYEGRFTPVDTDRESIIYPGLFGGIEWGGVAVDPVRRLMIVNPTSMPFRLRMARVGTPAAAGLTEMPGTGYAEAHYVFFSPLHIPCMQPPWGGLFAIDLDTQRVLWKRPVGSALDSGPRGIASRLPLLIGTPQVGGAIVTRGGLIFSAATLDQYLRAYDVRTGRELWKARLPAGGQATPMTYEINRRQYVAISAGGHSGLGTKIGDHVIAWALPPNP